MKTSLKKHVRLLSVKFYLIILFIFGVVLFFYYYGQYSLDRQDAQMSRHSKVIQQDVWSFDIKGAEAYLKLVSYHEEYESAVILDVTGNEILRVQETSSNTFDFIVGKVGLLPRIVTSKNIVHDGEIIGQLVVSQREKSIYIKLFATMCWGLICIVIFLFFKTGEAKHLLERRVAERTKELQKEIDERQIAEVNRIKLEDELQRSEKMKLLGTLAGGVAHDLNNIMGAIVGYPDLLLLDMEKNDPYRKPIEAIQQSGEKAANIVHDLLVLARRSVNVKKVENINEVISQYFESREFTSLDKAHPKIHFESDLKDTLLNIEGSSVHLSKIIMNLVTNAVEAMPDGGSVKVATNNIYLDTPIQGYETINEGDYVVISVSDEGIGIADEDKKKIFEPFYSKKKMGRSGTGLGMTIIWGSVGDHNGYIDIQNNKDNGTTFFIYIPATQKESDDVCETIPLDLYVGKQQKVLVIDDVLEQRNVASDMLIKLNYDVISVSSGEEAINYLQSYKVNILLLDMIMEPGIDGLDTYREIIKIFPDQKAIIASGYSQTDRIEKLQKLGAGSYIKKPYTLEILGVAIKNELERT